MSEKISRRNFLKKSALVGGAIAMGATVLKKTPSTEPPLGHTTEQSMGNGPVEVIAEGAYVGPEASRAESQVGDKIAWLPEEVRALWPTIVRSAQEFDIDPRLVAIIITEESGGKNIPNTAGSDAMGPMQLMPVAITEYQNKSGDSRVRDIANPADNIHVGCWHVNNVNKNYLIPAGIDIYSDLGIMALAVGYGDGVGALRAWQRGGMKPSDLSEQAQYITRLWTGMWYERNQKSSQTLNIERGYNT